MNIISPIPHPPLHPLTAMAATPIPTTSDHAVTIDLDQEWVTSLQTKLQLLPLRNRGRANPPTIFKVPAIIRESDPDSYEPKIISMGPYHSRNPALEPMNNLKLRYLRKFLRQNADVALEDYLRLIKSLEPQARSCYASACINDIGSNEFVEMMLLDGCFIVKLLFMQLGPSSEYNREDEDEGDDQDPIMCTTWTLPLIEYDLLMLENQIPFFVFESLFNLVTNGDGDESCSLIELLLSFFDDHIPSDRIVVPSDEIVPKFHHILHFFHSCIMPEATRGLDPQSKTKRYKPMIYRKLGKIKRLPTLLYRHILSSVRKYSVRTQIDDEKNHSTDSPPPTPESVPCAMKLKEAGVRFRNIKARSFLDVTFKMGIMRIPTLQVYDQTNCLFRNLIAFEQCFPEVGMHVSAYAVLMDCLVDTAEDVALLHHYGCIVNGLGNDNDASALFNSLCKEIAIDYEACYLAGLFKDVKKHCDWRWNRWRAKLMHDYFSNPWAILSLIGALVLIFLTVIQTGFAVISYFRPPS